MLFTLIPKGTRSLQETEKRIQASLLTTRVSGWFVFFVNDITFEEITSLLNSVRRILKTKFPEIVSLMP